LPTLIESRNSIGMKFEDLERRLQPPEELNRRDWRKHKNGGGWVEKSATVAPTAFVGPKAMVLRAAQVLDSAQIMGETIVTAGAIVAGRVHAAGKSRIGDLARVSGTTRLLDVDIGGYAVLTQGELVGIVYRPRDLPAKKGWKKAQLVR
jgi:hypothetical protein